MDDEPRSAQLPSRETENQESDLNKLIDDLVQEHRMPGTVAREFKETHYDPQQELTPYIRRILNKDTPDILKTRVDSNRTQLEMETVIIYGIQTIVDRSIDKVHSAYAQKEPHEVEERVTQMLPDEYRDRLQARLAATDAEDIEGRIQAVTENYLLATLSRVALFAGDKQKLKSANDFGVGQRPDMSGERYVDEYGFKEWGRQMQALSILTGSPEYLLSFQDLAGQTIEDPHSNFEERQISPREYLKRVIDLCGEEDLRYCKQKKIQIIPASKRPAGDESLFRAEKYGDDENGIMEPLSEEDLQVVSRLITRASHTVIGTYDHEDAYFKRQRAREIFGARYNLGDDDAIEVSLDIRIGGGRLDNIMRGIPLNSEEQAELIERGSVSEVVELDYHKFIDKAEQEMDRRKSRETMEMLHAAINGDRNAQITVTMLVEQGRFPGNIQQLKAEIAQLEPEGQIDDTYFNEQIVKKIERRQEERAD